MGFPSVNKSTAEIERKNGAHERGVSLPVDEGLEDHLHEGDEGVEDPVGEPLLVVQLRRALHSLHGRIPAHTYDMASVQPMVFAK